MLRYLRKKPYKEAHRADLERLKLRKSKLGARFHLRDIVGRCDALATKRPGGEMVQLAER